MQSCVLYDGSAVVAHDNVFAIVLQSVEKPVIYFLRVSNCEEYADWKAVLLDSTAQKELKMLTAAVANVRSG